MKPEDVHAIAKSSCIDLGKLSRIGLIRLIQDNEGNVSCYGTAHDSVCDQDSCLWRNGCISVALKSA